MIEVTEKSESTNVLSTTVNVLGTEYSILYCNEEEHELLKGKYRDGFTDNSVRQIVICEKKPDCELQDYEAWKKIVLRHEIIHAFLFESGLDVSSACFSGPWATNEEMVDWIAIQFPKMQKAFEEVGCI